MFQCIKTFVYNLYQHQRILESYCGGLSGFSCIDDQKPPRISISVHTKFCSNNIVENVFTKTSVHREILTQYSVFSKIKITIQYFNSQNRKT